MRILFVATLITTVDRRERLLEIDEQCPSDQYRPESPSLTI